ncbi:uncharacterized protein LOC101953547 isoform X2 [Chrysemys picta bellii]|uniref:uncharacterized protein LOC101953547 isoform X2 n=1 Tax=Chrysemys picta bellii TaxID=8478 RepID=UPI0032B2ADEB
MSSPASTPNRRGSKRGRSSNPPTRLVCTTEALPAQLYGKHALKMLSLLLHKNVEQMTPHLQEIYSQCELLQQWTCKAQMLKMFCFPAHHNFENRAVTKEMFEEALHALADDDFLTVTGKTVRLL